MYQSHDHLNFFPIHMNSLNKIIVKVLEIHGKECY
jgi:hypothetical protein